MLSPRQIPREVRAERQCEIPVISRAVPPRARRQCYWSTPTTGCSAQTEGASAEQPSHADEVRNHNLRQALLLFDVRVIDHLIAAGPTVLSFAECGLI